MHTQKSTAVDNIYPDHAIIATYQAVFDATALAYPAGGKSLDTREYLQAMTP
ncbi:MAG: hypothetical protein L3J22_00400 [Xanthomonadales bacterium]|nr:hypothetical protein [Xanthomonadales bacterium]